MRKTDSDVKKHRQWWVMQGMTTGPLLMSFTHISTLLSCTPPPPPPALAVGHVMISLQGNRRRYTLPAQDTQWMVELWSESRRLDSEPVLRTLALLLRWEASILQASACVLRLLVWSTALLVLGKLSGENFSADLVGRPPSLPVFFFHKPPLRGHCVWKILKWL